MDEKNVEIGYGVFYLEGWNSEDNQPEDHWEEFENEVQAKLFLDKLKDRGVDGYVDTYKKHEFIRTCDNCNFVESCNEAWVGEICKSHLTYEEFIIASDAYLDNTEDEDTDIDDAYEDYRTSLYI